MIEKLKMNVNQGKLNMIHEIQDKINEIIDYINNKKSINVKINKPTPLKCVSIEDKDGFIRDNKKE